LTAKLFLFVSLPSHFLSDTSLTLLHLSNLTMFNYHEMTVGQQVHYSDDHRLQFRIISAIMAAIFAHSVWNAGGMSSINIQEGIFPGGNFLYQFHQR
jgi:hypothetical protein